MLGIRFSVVLVLRLRLRLTSRLRLIKVNVTVRVRATIRVKSKRVRRLLSSYCYHTTDIISSYWRRLVSG